MSSLGSAYEKGYIATANTWANTQTISLSSLGSAYEKGYILTANTWANTRTISLSSVQSIDVRNNALMVLDASNINSYPGTGTTWYDISGGGYHATLGGTPQLLGTGDDKYFRFSSGNNLTVPSVVTVNVPSVGNTNSGSFTYIMVGSLGTVGTLRGTNMWSKDVRPALDGKENFTSGDYNSPNTYSVANESSSWATGSQLAMWYGTFSANIQSGYPAPNSVVTVSTYQGGSIRSTIQTSYYTSINPAYTFASGFIDTGSNIKLILLYNTINAPTLSQAYAALNGRFGL